MIKLNFKGMLNNWLMDLELTTTTDAKIDDSGIAVKGDATVKTIKGAFVPQRDRLNYREGGLLEEGSKVLFTHEYIPKKSTIAYNGLVYSVEEATELENNYSDFNKYICKRVGGVN